MTVALATLLYAVPTAAALPLPVAAASISARLQIGAPDYVYSSFSGEGFYEISSASSYAFVETALDPTPFISAGVIVSGPQTTSAQARLAYAFVLTAPAAYTVIDPLFGTIIVDEYAELAYDLLHDVSPSGLGIGFGAVRLSGTGNYAVQGTHQSSAYAEVYSTSLNASLPPYYGYEPPFYAYGGCVSFAGEYCGVSFRFDIPAALTIGSPASRGFYGDLYLANYVSVDGPGFGSAFIDPTITLSGFDASRWRLTLSPGVANPGGNFGIGDDPVGGVPEPANWALLIAGFAMAGTRLRRRRRIAGVNPVRR
jgi:hypothetical protein